MSSRKLSGKESRELAEAIISAYPSIPRLKMMVYYELNKNLDSIAGGSDLQVVVFNLIDTAQTEGWLEDLISGARNRNPGNPDLQAIAQKLLSNSFNNSPVPTVNPPNPNPTIQTQPFKFETATLIVKTGFFGSKCEIKRSLSTAKSFKEDLGNGVLLEMVEIPLGHFLMGSPENEPERLDSEGPQHIVTIQPFLMGKFPVTQVQYQIIMGENPSYFKGVNKPVECVSWDNAVEFCDRISQRTGKTYRLPSEAEWEYACRAGTTTPFYFGDTITTDLANYNGNYTYGSAPKGQSRKQTTDVGYFPANAFGLYDMHGNVWEWCEDTWHSNYEGAPTKGQPWIDNVNDNYCQYRLLRGGSWFINPWDFAPRFCRCACRDWDEHNGSDSVIGFRVVLACPRT